MTRLCECCNYEPAIGVASIAGIAMSIAWGKTCLQAGVIPYWALVSNTVCIGSLEHAADWWQEIVDRTLTYFGFDMEDFLKDVERVQLALQAGDIDDTAKELLVTDDNIKYVTCPECGEDQIDMARDVSCKVCGYYPMPFHDENGNLVEL